MKMTAVAPVGKQSMEVLRGQSTKELEPLSNVIRVFISSTFTDMSSERSALYDKAYPELQTFCQSLGLVFEVVDMRWGLKDGITTDHMTTELCLKEIEACKKLSVVPSFIALLGSRYGHRPVPRTIPEKLFRILLSKQPKDQQELKILNQWFLIDNNACPPVYVLQPITNHLPHYDDLRPESGPQRDKDVLSWQYIEAKLLKLLRTAATQAEKDGDITTEQKHQFFKSATESEIEVGLRGQDSKTSAIVFVRELPRLHMRDVMRSKRLAQHIDLTADGILDTEARDLLAALKSSLYASLPGILNLHCVELSRGAINPERKEHANYLDSMCEQFVSQMKARILNKVGSPVGLGVEGERSGSEGSKEEGEENWSQVIEEVRLHTALSTDMCTGFCGREGLLGKVCLAMWESTNTRHRPLIVHGEAGMGKTALLCKLAQEMRHVLDSRAVVIVRLLGTVPPPRADVDCVLRSVCTQICAAFRLPLPTPLIANTPLELVGFFHCLLDKVSQQGDMLLLILDSLDQLSEVNHAHKLYWLPKDIPPNVHLVVSTNTKTALDLQQMIDAPGHFFEIKPLSHEEGKEIIDAYMRGVQRTLTSEQRDAILSSFEKCGNPMHLMLTLDMAKRWASYTPLKELCLSSSPQEVMSQMFHGLEKRHGKRLVGAALGYITAARNGLLEAELRDVLSLDNDVMAEVYQYSLPPNPRVIRLPSLLWARLRHDLGDQLVERQAYGMMVLSFQHRQVTEMVEERYLGAEQRRQRHRVLAENFLGEWSRVKLKPIMLPTMKAPMIADRKVSPQPLWLTESLANTRKLQELPYHLIKAGLWDELRQEVIGSTEWLYCKTLTCGVASVIQDLSLCIHLMDCPETQLIRDALILLKPTLDFLDGHIDRSLFFTELYARLYSLAEVYPSLIGQLCSQSQDWLMSCPEPVLVPKCTFLQPPGGALKRTLLGFQKGITALDVCCKTGVLAAGSEDGKVIIWDLEDLDVIHNLVGHTATVLCIKVINRGTGCLSLAADGTLRKWSLLSGRPLYCIQEAISINSSPPIAHILLSEEEALMFVYTRDQMKAWHLDSAEQAFKVMDADSVILGLLNGAVVSLSDKGLVIFSYPSNGTKMVQIQLETSGQRVIKPLALMLQKNGRILIASKKGFLYQVSSTGSQTVTEFCPDVSFLSLADDERTLLAGCERTLKMFHVERDSIKSFLDLQHEDTVLCARISRDNQVVVTGSEDQTIRVWSVTTGILLDSLHGMEAPVSGLVLFAGGVISASSGANYLKLWQLKYDPQHKPKACIPAGCAHVALTNDGDMVLYVKREDQHEIFAWNCHTGSLTETMATPAEVCCLELAQHKRLLFCGLRTGTVLIYPLASPQDPVGIPPPETFPRVCCLAVGSRDKYLAVAYEDSMCLFEIVARDSHPSVEGPFKKFPLSLLHSPVSAMALLSDCRLLYGTGCGEVTLYDFKSATAKSLESHHGRVTCITASNWGAHALVGSDDAVQRLWGLTPLVLDHTMEYKGFFFEGVICAAFSENDQYIFTGSRDRTINVWDAATGNLLYVQYVYAPVIKMLPQRNGFVAISQQGYVIKAGFHCPDQISPKYNPLRNVKAQYRVMSRDKDSENCHTALSEVPDYFNFTGMLKSKPSGTCQLL